MGRWSRRSWREICLREREEDGAVAQVASPHELFDPFQDDGALGVDDAALGVGKRRVALEVPPGGQQAQAIGQPRGYHADIVVGQQPTVDGSAHQAAGVSGLGEQGGGLGVDQQPDDPCKGALGRALLAAQRQDGIGADGPDCGGHPDDQEAKIGLGEVDVGSEQLDRALAAGRGERKVPLGVPKVGGGLSTTDQPSGPNYSAAHGVGESIEAVTIATGLWPRTTLRNQLKTVNPV